MNRNTKIALGCGGAGCLGLILLVIVCVVLVVTGVVRAPGIYNANSNSNDNDNSNYNTNENSNANTKNNLNTNSISESSDSSSMSEDDKHKLYQAAGMSKDAQLMQRVIRKIGLGDGSGDDHQEFIKAHFSWAMKNLEFIRSVNTAETARAYVEAHIDD